MDHYSDINTGISAVQRYGSDLSVSPFLCRCTNDKCDPDTGECMDGESCIDGHPRGMGFEWRGKGCRTGVWIN